MPIALCTGARPEPTEAERVPKLVRQDAEIGQAIGIGDVQRGPHLHDVRRLIEVGAADQEDDSIVAV